MKLLRFLLSLCFAFLLSGCVVISMFPFYDESDLVFVPDLAGEWTKANGEDKGKETWEFKKWDAKGWWLKSTDQEGKQEFTAEVHTFKLKETLFLDMAVAVMGEGMEQAIRPHFLFKVSQTKPTLKWALLSEDWMKKILEKDPKALRHQVPRKEDGTAGDDTILTAETRELREFLLKHRQDAEAFKDVDELRRVKP